MNGDLNDRLLDVIRAASNTPALVYARPPRPLTGGFWAELVAFSLADPPPGWPSDLVARLMPEAGTARKETIVQGAVAAAGFPTPAVRVTGGTDDGLGRAFMIMDLAPGGPLLSGLAGPGVVTEALRLARRIPDVLASTMAGLHALDPEPVRDLLRQAGTMPVTVPDLLGWLGDMAAGWQRPDLADSARWLLGHQRPASRDVICHGDLHPFNVLAHGGQVTVLDWTAALLAPPAYDLAYTALMLAEPPLQVPAPARGLVRRVGRNLARRFVRRYEAHAGVTVGQDELAWHQAAISLRALTEVAGWVHGGTIGDHADHPYLVSGRQIAARLRAVTGIPALPR